MSYSLSESTYRYYRDHVLRAFCDWLDAQGMAAVEDITREDVIAFLRDQRKHTFSYKNQEHVVRTISQRYFEQRFYAVRRFFNWCVEQRYLEVSPMATIRPPRGEKRVRYAFTQEEAVKLRQEARRASGILGLRDYAMVVTLLGTGARPGELCAMSTSCARCPNGCIDLANSAVVLHGKGSKDRRVRLGKDARTAIRLWLDKRPVVPGGWVWTTQRRTGFSVVSLNKWANKLGAYAGVANCHPHRFRHTFATQFYVAHRDIVALKNVLGHTKIATTEHYLRQLGIDYTFTQQYPTPDEWLK